MSGETQYHAELADSGVELLLSPLLLGLKILCIPSVPDKDLRCFVLRPKRNEVAHLLGFRIVGKRLILLLILERPTPDCLLPASWTGYVGTVPYGSL